LALHGVTVRLVGRVKFLDVEAVAPVVLLVDHVRNGGSFNGARTVTLLSIQRAAVTTGTRLNLIQNQIIGLLLSISEGASLRIVSKVGLVHQLLVKARVDGDVVTGGSWGRPSLLSFEKFGQNELLLLLHSIHIDSFTLDRSIKVVCLFVRIH